VDHSIKKPPAAFCRDGPNSLAAFIKRPQAIFQIGVKVNLGHFAPKFN
jgi:hypothetical protein